ncbi:MAG: RNA polymerase sigma factor [Bacteroidetes bacterium]|nr:MAG: RNA polymerase sigma factor [Bacteroidota bacterium]
MSAHYLSKTDEELVALITNGATDLYGILYDRYADKVYRKCLSFVKNEQIAQDNVQDIFLKVFFQLSKFKGKSRFSTWLYAITYNYCVEYYRRNTRYTHVEVDERIELTEDETEEQELLKLRTEQLARALDKVAPEDKVILLMKYQDNMSIKEIMEQLDIAESAVKMRLARARKRVKAVIQQQEKELV